MSDSTRTTYSSVSIYSGNSFNDNVYFESECRYLMGLALGAHDPFLADFSTWAEFADRVDCSFAGGNAGEGSVSTQFINSVPDNYKNTCSVFLEAINNYRHEFEGISNARKISSKSAKNFLYLIPILNRYHPQISVDADTGYLSVTLSGSGANLLSALVTDKGDVHFSLVESGKRIFKLSGVAKVKDSYDYNKVRKIFELL